jgi:chromosomal replication initiation ATPase DnaA
MSSTTPSAQWTLPLKVPGVADAFVVGDANRAAAEAVLRDGWTGPIYLEGPPACGKTLLASLWCDWAGGTLWQTQALSLEAARPDAARAFAVDGLERLPAGSEEPLFHLFNAVTRGHGRLLLTGRLAPRALEVALPDLRTRLNSVPVVRIEPPDDDLLVRLMLHLAERRQLAVPPDVLPFLLGRMARTYAAAVNVIEALDRLSLEQGRPVGRDLAAEALAAAEN